MKKRIVLNKSYGGFELSEEAKELYCKYKGITLFKYNYDKDRFKLVDFKSDRYYFYSYICDEKEIRDINLKKIVRFFHFHRYQEMMKY